jgi:hypothetical protein
MVDAFKVERDLFRLCTPTQRWRSLILLLLSLDTSRAQVRFAGLGSQLAVDFSRQRGDHGWFVRSLRRLGRAGPVAAGRRPWLLGKEAVDPRRYQGEMGKDH